MTIQEIIDALSNGYDAGLLTREDVYQRLQNYVKSDQLQQFVVDRLFDLIVG